MREPTVGTGGEGGVSLQRAVEALEAEGFVVELSAWPTNTVLRWRRRGAQWAAAGDEESVWIRAMAWLDARRSGIGDELDYAEDESR